jgi:hypothetical protein
MSSKKGRYFENGVEKFAGTTTAPADTVDAEEELIAIEEEKSLPKMFQSTAPERKPGKSFPLGVALQIASGRMLSNDIEDVFDALTHMSGVRIEPRSYPDALNACRPELFRQYPELKKYEFIELPKDADDVAEWLANQEKKLGATIRIDKLPTNEQDDLQQLVERKLRLLEKPKKKKKNGSRGIADEEVFINQVIK